MLVSGVMVKILWRVSPVFAWEHCRLSVPEGDDGDVGSSISIFSYVLPHALEWRHTHGVSRVQVQTLVSVVKFGFASQGKRSSCVANVASCLNYVVRQITGNYISSQPISPLMTLDCNSR